MRLRTVASLGAALGLGLPLALLLAQGPIGTGSETVARPRKTRDSQTAPAETPTPTLKQEQAAPPATSPDRVPSVFRKKGDAVGTDDPLFRSEANSVTVDVSVVNPKGQFIPGIPRGNFRVLEDGVPQKVDSYAMGEAPMTVAVVVEF